MRNILKKNPFNIIIFIVILLLLSLHAKSFAKESTLTKADDLISPANESVKLNQVEKNKVSKIRESKYLKSSLVSFFDKDAIYGDTINIKIKDSTLQLIKKDERNFGSAKNITGSASNGGHFGISIDGEKITGYIETGDTIYYISNISNDKIIITEPKKLKNTIPHPYENKRGAEILGREPSSIKLNSIKIDNNAAAALSTTIPIIRVLFVYSQEALSITNDINSLAVNSLLKMNNSINETISYGIDPNGGDSSVYYKKFQVESAGVIGIEKNYSATTIDAALNDFAYLMNVRSKRDEVEADVVVLFGSFQNSGSDIVCGKSKQIYADAYTAFSAIDVLCQYNGSRTFSHELGHLMGAQHQKELDSDVYSSVYGHGFWYASSWTNAVLCYHTIMAYSLAFQNKFTKSSINCQKDHELNTYSVNAMRYTYPPLLGGDGYYWSVPYLGDSTTFNVMKVLSDSAPKVTLFRKTKWVGATESTSILQSLLQRINSVVYTIFN